MDRNLALRSLYEVLSVDSTSQTKLLNDAVELEHAVFVRSQGVASSYPFQVLTAIQLTRNGKLQGLRHAAATPRCYVELLEMSFEGIYHSIPCQDKARQDEALRIQGESLLRDLSSPDLSDVPDAGIRCGKCKSTEIAFDFLQTRSADEGTTVYCSCTACGKRWKM